MRSAVLLVIFVFYTGIDSIWALTYSCDPTLRCGCSISSTTGGARIAGGEIVSIIHGGWMISLRENGRHRCGATLVSLEYVVTSAGCVLEFQDTPSVLTIVAGTNQRIAKPFSNA